MYCKAVCRQTSTGSVAPRETVANASCQNPGTSKRSAPLNRTLARSDESQRSLAISPPVKPALIPCLCRRRLHIFNSYPRDAVAVHFFDGEAFTAVITNIADGGNFLQFRKHE